MIVLLRLTFFSLAAALSHASFAHDYIHQQLQIEHPWARATAPGQTVGAAYFVIKNNGTQADALIAVRSPSISRAPELHSHAMANGVMHMRRVPQIALPAGATVALAPHGYHVMLTALRQPLHAGQRIPAELVFKKAGRVKVMLNIEPLDYQPHGGATGTQPHSHAH